LNGIIFYRLRRPLWHRHRCLNQRCDLVGLRFFRLELFSEFPHQDGNGLRIPLLAIDHRRVYGPIHSCNRSRREFVVKRGPFANQGTNENTNGLLRQYFPKRTDWSGYSQADLDKVALRLINAHEKPWALKLLRVNSKPVLHRPVETARLCGNYQMLWARRRER
jgi:hypothetical protein